MSGCPSGRPFWISCTSGCSTFTLASYLVLQRPKTIQLLHEQPRNAAPRKPCSTPVATFWWPPARIFWNSKATLQPVRKPRQPIAALGWTLPLFRVVPLCPGRRLCRVSRQLAVQQHCAVARASCQRRHGIPHYTFDYAQHVVPDKNRIAHLPWGQPLRIARSRTGEGNEWTNNPSVGIRVGFCVSVEPDDNRGKRNCNPQ